jgi:hypothetical protein
MSRESPVGRRGRWRWPVAALCLVQAASAAFAAPPGPQPEAREERPAPRTSEGIKEKMRTLIQGGALAEPRESGQPAMPPSPAGSPADPALPLPPDPGVTDQTVKDAFRAAMLEYYAYRQSGLQHRQRVFQWQLWSSKVIFFAVLSLVAAGLYFAALQFHRRPGPPGQPGEAGGEPTEVTASFEGIKVRSPILGVIILIISLLFFYLYLLFVYPIREIF